MEKRTNASEEAISVVCRRAMQYRKSRGLSQAELAEALGVSAAAVGHWEHGRARPDVDVLPLLAGALGVSLNDLYGLEEGNTQWENALVSKVRSLSEGKRCAVEQLVDALVKAERTERDPALKRLLYFERRLSAGRADPTEWEERGQEVYVYASPEVMRGDYVFTVNGNSMEPDFYGGQDVLVQRIEGGGALGIGEVGAFIVGSETYIKEYRQDGLYSRNPDYAPMRFSGDETVYLIGRVLGVLDKRAYAGPEEVAYYRENHRG